MKYIYCFLFFFSTISLYSCTQKNSSDNSITTRQDSSLITQIERFDLDIYNYLQNPTKEEEAFLKSKYGDLLEAFGAVSINNSDVNNSDFFKTLQNYFSNASLTQIYNDELSVFKDMQTYNDELTNANELIYKNFEGNHLPNLSMHVSGLKENIIVTDSIISISADKYLGSDYPIYTSFFENYQLNQMQPQMLVRDILKAWLLTEIPKNSSRNNLLSEMVNKGKVLYALTVLLPNCNESDLLGYSDKQLSWSQENEKNIWNTTLQNKYLYTKDSQIINKFMNEAPYTATMSPQSPGQLGSWIGYQIVKSYMANEENSLNQLFKEEDIQKILKLSKYNP